MYYPAWGKLSWHGIPKPRPSIRKRVGAGLKERRAGHQHKRSFISPILTIAPPPHPGGSSWSGPHIAYQVPCGRVPFMDLRHGSSEGGRASCHWHCGILGNPNQNLSRAPVKTVTRNSNPQPHPTGSGINRRLRCTTALPRDFGRQLYCLCAGMREIRCRYEHHITSEGFGSSCLITMQY